MIPNDSIDFYPTPDDLADDMIRALRASNDGSGLSYLPEPILEPSAGNGAIARAVERAAGIYREHRTGKITCGHREAKALDLDCVELSADFRAVLKKDGFRVVHDDFLTFRPCKQYAAIAMNPPFSAGAAHLLKALDIMKDGGKIACILNAETIRNPYTNERKELVQKLDALGAKITYKQNAFQNAARRSGVEIALVVVNIPQREPVSKIRLELQHETERRFREDENLAALVSSDPITAAIERYNAAAQGIRRIYEEYNGIKSLFSSATEGDKESAVLGFDKSYNAAIHDLRAMYWKKLFDMPQIRDNLTYEMLREYQSRIADLANYDFSAYNIWTVREEISRNLVAGIEHEIISLFDDWTSLHYHPEYSKNIHYYNGWCTNEAYKVGRKVIFNCNAFEYWSYNRSHEFYPHRVYDKIRSIELVLHYLDTSGKPYDSEELRKTLDDLRGASSAQNIQLRYFKATFYKKGTCHIEFTNEDVLKSFNLFASQKKGWLPPSYGKKSYRDMSAADKKVVDSFEGEASYTDTLARGLIPTTKTLLRLGA